MGGLLRSRSKLASYPGRLHVESVSVPALCSLVVLSVLRWSEFPDTMNVQSLRCKTFELSLRLCRIVSAFLGLVFILLDIGRFLPGIDHLWTSEWPFNSVGYSSWISHLLQKRFRALFRSFTPGQSPQQTLHYLGHIGSQCNLAGWGSYAPQANEMDPQHGDTCTYRKRAITAMISVTALKSLSKVKCVLVICFCREQFVDLTSLLKAQGEHSILNRIKALKCKRSALK